MSKIGEIPNSNTTVVATINQGFLCAQQGQEKEGIAQMQRGLAALQNMGDGLARPYFLALLAEAYGRVRQADEGLMALSEALTAIDKAGERWCEAELYRLKGELALQQVDDRDPISGNRRVAKLLRWASRSLLSRC
jgi:predicted ATPase